MVNKIYLFIAIFFIAFNNLSAANISGNVSDEKDNPMMGATIKLLDVSDKFISGEKSLRNGSFKFSSVKSGKYKLEITYVGYETINKDISVIGNNDIELGKIRMKETEIMGKTVIVEAQATTGELNKDTAQFNAKAFKTAENSVAEDLVKKIPGVEVGSDGTIKAQGESVKKVLVDGKPFFGNDPKVAMKNLPAEVIDKVQIYDKNSDNSQFAGREDDDKEKAINFITKVDKRKGIFGKLSAGYGTDSRYNANLAMNIMNDQRRYSVLAMSNNVSIQNFSFSDIMGLTGSGGGGGGRMFRFSGGGGANTSPNIGSALQRPNFRGGSFSTFMVNPSDGISKNHSIGINYSDVYSTWGELSGSYFFNTSDNDNTQDILRNYFAIGDSAYTFNQNGAGAAKNLNHRFNARFTAKFDSSNSVMILPNFTYQSNNMNSNSATVSQYDFNGNKINESKNNYMTDYSGYNFSNNLTYVYKFANPKRNISLELDNTINKKDGYSLQRAETKYFEANQVDSVNQKINLDTKDYSYDIDIDYVEPITDSSSLRFSVEHSNSVSENDNEANSFNIATQNYDIRNDLYSSKFSNTYQTNTLGINYRYQKGIFELSTRLRYEMMELKSDLTLPRVSTISYSANTFLPSMRIALNFTKTNSFRLFYYTFNIAPTASQLLEVPDKSNPLQIYIGNESLKPQYAHNFHSNYMMMSEDFKSSFSIFGNIGIRNNYISNSYYTAKKDTVIDKITLPAGSQLYRPINMDGYFDSRLFVNYSFPIEYLLLKISLGGGGNYNTTPGVINGLENKAQNYGYNFTLGLNSNISQDLDFNIGTGYNFNFTKNSVETAQNYTYKAVSFNADLNWTMFWGIFITANSNNIFYLDKRYSNSQNINVLNLSIGKKFLQNNAAVIELKVFDVLDKNNNIGNNITDRYTEIATNNILRRYLLLSFSYNLRSFGGKF